MVILLIGTVGYAQDIKQKVKHEQKGDLVEATYFYADGSTQQVGTFNKEGKLHGTWISYDTNGNKTAVGEYNNGKKTGKWMFSVNGKINEVYYQNSKITKINEVSDLNSL